MDTTELTRIVELNGKYWRGEEGGVRADLSGADLSDADLKSANLRSADLRSADLSDASGLLDPVEWLETHFERDPDGRGYLVFKQFGASYPSPAAWEIKPGAIITEVVNPDRASDCACGVNFAVRGWSDFRRDRETWRCLLHWRDLAGVVVPFMTDGKARCGRLELLGIVEE